MVWALSHMFELHDKKKKKKNLDDFVNYLPTFHTSMDTALAHAVPQKGIHTHCDGQVTQERWLTVPTVPLPAVRNI